MAGNGNTDAARLWSLADLYVGDYTAGTPTAEPTDLTTDLTTVDYDLVGLLSQDDKIGRNFSAQQADKFAYGNLLVRSTFTQEKITFTATAWEDTDLVFKLANPGSTTETTGGETRRVRKATNTGLAIKSVVVDLEDGDVAKRIWIPKAQVLLTGDAPIADSEIAGYPLTIAALAYASGGADGTFFFTELTDDPEAVVTS